MNHTRLSRLTAVPRPLLALDVQRPGIPGHSENIRVLSRLGRFLEHARIYHFANAGADEYYIGSADWRPRNLRRRIEVVAPVLDEDGRAELDAMLIAELSDPAAWLLRADGSYEQRTPTQEPQNLVAAKTVK